MTARTAVPAPPMMTVPPLETGDHLTRDEFERRYNAMPPSIWAELLEGVVFLKPPRVGWTFHAVPHAELLGWLGTYCAGTPHVQGGKNPSLRLDLDNEPQPDAALLIEPTYGGQARFSDDHFVVGAPELVAEISGTTVNIDTNLKFRVYRRNGVREYLVWRVRDQAIDWFALRRGQYEKLPINFDGILRSEVFPGLWLHVPALLAGDMARVLKVLDQGVRTKEHAEFVGSLRARAGEQA